MSEKMTNILGYATLFAILGAIWVMFGEDPALDQGGRGEATFEGLADRINETAVLEVVGADQAVTLKRGPSGAWQVSEKNAYPADTEKVTAYLKGMALSKRREPKTANTDRFDALGMGADGLDITLRDDTGGVLRSFKMGKRTGSPSGRSLTYMYQGTDTRAWLVTELAEASADPAWWLKTDLLSLNQVRVKSLTLGGVTLVRALGENNFTVEGLKGGEKAASYWKLAEPQRVITGLDIMDVKKLANPLADPVKAITLDTYDGLQLTLTLFAMDGGHWAQVAASFSEERRSSGAAGTLPAAPEDGAAEAAAINASTQGWLFKLGESDATALLQKRSAFLEAKAE